MKIQGNEIMAMAIKIKNIVMRYSSHPKL